jgi:protein TonB
MISLAFLVSLAVAPAIAAPPVPRAPLEGLVSVDDYPPAAGGVAGTTRVLLDVASMGRVTACRVLASSGTAALDAATCRILASRARFTPAMDSTGMPVAASFEASIGWSPPPTFTRLDPASPR